MVAMATETGIDSARILREQYKDGANLSARIRLHQRFSTNRYGQMRWIFDRIQIPENARVLELGCGTGILWRGSAQVPSGWRVILTDMSDGMLRETRASLARLGRSFTYAQADAQAAREEADRAAGRKRPGRPRIHDPKQKPLLVNVTDLDSKAIKTARGFVQGYNAQAVATTDQVIIAAELTNHPADVGELAPTFAAAEANLIAAGVSEPIGTLVADAGYYSTANATLHTSTEVLIATAKFRDLPTTLEPTVDTGRRQSAVARKHAVRLQMQARLATDEGRARYRQRSPAIEPIFGQIKHGRAMGRFQRRGLAACSSEWKLIAATHNLLKLRRHTLEAASDEAADLDAARSHANASTPAFPARCCVT